MLEKIEIGKEAFLKDLRKSIFPVIEKGVLYELRLFSPRPTLVIGS
ncbi:MAG: hypothetical protein V5A88_05580 [Candidatus Thermoplasmatota archaeon]